MKKEKQFIHIVIILLLMFGFGKLPTFGPVTPFGMKVLGIFLGLIYAWTIDIVMWPCLLGIVLFASIQNTTMLATLAGVIGNQTLLQVAVILAFCYALDVCGLLSYIGNWIMTKKIVTKSPYYLLSTFWIVAYIGSALCLTNGSVLLMLWAIYYKIADEVGIKRYSAYTNTMLIGIAVISYIGSIFFPFSLWPNIVFGLYMSVTGTAIAVPYGTYMLMNLIVGVITFVLCLGVTKFIVKPETDFDLSNVKIEVAELKMTSIQKFALISVLGSVIFLLLPSMLPTEWVITKWMNNMSIAGIFIIILILMSTFKDPQTGEKIINLAAVVKNGVPWDQFFLLALAFYMASLLTDVNTGISALFTMILEPVLANKGIILTTIIFIFASVILTNCINNVVCTSLFMPLVALFAGEMDVVVLVMGMSMALIQGCAMPSGSVIGGLLHGNKEWLMAKDIYGYASLYTLFVAFAITLCVIFLG